MVDLAKADEILVAPEPATRLKDNYPLEWVGKKQLKNISKPVDIYKILTPIQVLAC